MISQVNGSAVRSAYISNSGEQKAQKRESMNVLEQGDMSKVEKIKESLASGEYKVDLQALSEKIADELL
ncbi:MAG: flagellar biosynthesis protein FlgM [Helicobacteraceae bacterium CG2_30_36_10]|nr:MAG: flagellar biosynthesis protein FlgM [Helicobacteraceae bacterium CG2_30_36_10]